MAEKLTPQQILDISREKFKRAVAQSKPLMCWFSLTEQCDLHCKFCFADSRKRLPDELTREEIFRLLDNVAEAGTVNMSLGGGEPTLRADLLDIVRYAARQKQMMVALNTHGQHIDRKLARQLKWAGITQVKVSTDGLKDSHEWNRGPGTWDKCISALKACRDENIQSVIFICTVSQVNFEEVPQMTRMCMDMGIDIALVQLLPLGRGKAFRDLMLTQEQTEQWQKELFELQKVYGWTRIQFENRYQMPDDEQCMGICLDSERPCGFYDYSVGCISGIWQYCISATGKVVVGDVICPELEIGDLRTQKLSDIWQNSRLTTLLRNRDNLKGKCGECEYRYLCGGCRRTAYAMTGDILAEDPQCWRKPALARVADSLLGADARP